MTIDEINTIRLALDTPENNRHYIKHTTDAKIILEKHKAAINYTRCCTELKDKETISFRDWVNQNKYTRFGNGYQRNEIVFSKEEMWQRFESRN